MLSIMAGDLFGCEGSISRSSLNICAVVLILLSNVDTIFARHVSRPFEDEYEMECVAMIHRHGDRTPLGTYPTDPYKDYRWPGGLGALTQLGIRQLYELGTNIRSRYEPLKPSDGIYTQETAHAISSSPERTRMSAASMLAAFWEPHEDAKTLPIPWQPIPLDVIPAQKDYILYQADVKCTKYEQDMQKLIIDPEAGSSIDEFNRKNADLYEYLSQYMGQNVTNCLPGSFLFDSLFIQETNGLELPTWTDKVYPQPLLDVRARSFQLSTETDYMKRMRGGPILTHIYNEITQFQSGQSTQKINTYSAHDLTIHNILAALNIVGQTDPIPSYGSLLAFELYRNRYHCRENTVQMVYYANSTVKTPQRMKIPDCPGPCYFSDFEDIVEPLLITDYDQDCKP